MLNCQGGSILFRLATSRMGSRLINHLQNTNRAELHRTSSIVIAFTCFYSMAEMCVLLTNPRGGGGRNVPESCRVQDDEPEKKNKIWAKSNLHQYRTFSFKPHFWATDHGRAADASTDMIGPSWTCFSGKHKELLLQV